MQHKRKHIAVIVCMLLCVLLPLTAVAHPGRTDSRGGHHDRQNGGYHYHHGYPAHDHPGGVCPYEADAQAAEIEDGEDNNYPVVPAYGNDQETEISKAVNKSQVNLPKNEIGFFEIVLLVAWWGPILVIPIVLLILLIREKNSHSKNDLKYEKRCELLTGIWINALFGYFFYFLKLLDKLIKHFQLKKQSKKQPKCENLSESPLLKSSTVLFDEPHKEKGWFRDTFALLLPGVAILAAVVLILVLWYFS